MNLVGVEYAGFWRRFGALVIDGFILGFISLVFQMISLDSMGLGVVLAFLYQPFFESSVLQGTPGKALLNMRVTDMNGQRVSFKKALLRYLVRIVSSLMAGIGYLIMLFTEKRQTLHDLAAETLVIRGEIKNVNYIQAWYRQFLDVLGLEEKTPENNSSSATQAPSSTAPSADSSGEASVPASPADLAGLYELYQKGTLTEAEYSQKREELLKKL